MLPRLFAASLVLSVAAIGSAQAQEVLPTLVNGDIVMNLEVGGDMIADADGENAVAQNLVGVITHGVTVEGDVTMDVAVGGDMIAGAQGDGAVATNAMGLIGGF